MRLIKLRFAPGYACENIETKQIPLKYIRTRVLYYVVCIKFSITLLTFNTENIGQLLY